MRNSPDAMTEERRAAVRVTLPQSIEATMSGVPVRLLELSTIGGRVEHEERFPLTSPQLRITWEKTTITLPVKVARSEIAGRREQRLVYQSGIQFMSSDPLADGVIASILRWAQRESDDAPQSAPPRVTPPAKKETPSFDDSWIRQVSFLRRDDEDDLPYAQFRHTENGWVKDYVASPEQPEDGFTIAREDTDFAELQRTFEYADPDTRRMMRIALEAKLQQPK